MHLQPGVLVSYCASPDANYQVVNVDDHSDCVWLRSFPLRARCQLRRRVASIT